MPRVKLSNPKYRSTKVVLDRQKYSSSAIRAKKARVLVNPGICLHEASYVFHPSVEILDGSTGQALIWRLKIPLFAISFTGAGCDQYIYLRPSIGCLLLEDFVLTGTL